LLRKSTFHFFGCFFTLWRETRVERGLGRTKRRENGHRVISVPLKKREGGGAEPGVLANQCRKGGDHAK